MPGLHDEMLTFVATTRHRVPARISVAVMPVGAVLVEPEEAGQLGLCLVIEHD